MLSYVWKEALATATMAGIGIAGAATGSILIPLAAGGAVIGGAACTIAAIQAHKSKSLGPR